MMAITRTISTRVKAAARRAAWQLRWLVGEVMDILLRPPCGFFSGLLRITPSAVADATRESIELGKPRAATISSARGTAWNSDSKIRGPREVTLALPRWAGSSPVEGDQSGNPGGPQLTG